MNWFLCVLFLLAVVTAFVVGMFARERVRATAFAWWRRSWIAAFYYRHYAARRHSIVQATLRIRRMLNSDRSLRSGGKGIDRGNWILVSEETKPAPGEQVLDHKGNVVEYDPSGWINVRTKRPVKVMKWVRVGFEANLGLGRGDSPVDFNPLISSKRAKAIAKELNQDEARRTITQPPSPRARLCSVPVRV